MGEFSKLRFLFYEHGANQWCYTRGRVIRDYELDFHYDGGLTQYIDDVPYRIQKNSLVFRRPGQTVRSEGSYYCRMLTFDLSGEVVLVPGQNVRFRDVPIQRVGETPLLDFVPTVFTPRHAEDINAILERIGMLYGYNKSKENRSAALDSASLELLLLLCSDAVRDSAEIPPPRNPAVSAACRYVENNYMKSISLAGLAAVVHVSPDHLIRLFRRELGVTPNVYINSVRIGNSRLLLESTDSTIDDIARRCGFSDTAYFIKKFKESRGVTPKQYRGSVNKF